MNTSKQINKPIQIVLINFSVFALLHTECIQDSALLPHANIYSICTEFCDDFKFLSYIFCADTVTKQLYRLATSLFPCSFYMPYTIVDSSHYIFLLVDDTGQLLAWYIFDVKANSMHVLNIC